MQFDLLKLLPQFDVISFDIFDTLLLRPYLQPKDLWRVMEIESRSHESKSKDGSSDFFTVRNAAEVATYREATEKGCETTLDEAYARMDARWAAA